MIPRDQLGFGLEGPDRLVHSRQPEQLATVESARQPMAGAADVSRGPQPLNEEPAFKSAELRAEAQLEQYRLRMRLSDLEKRLLSKDDEISKLQIILRDLMSGGRAEIRPEPRIALDRRIEQLKAELNDAQAECRNLRRQLETSLALRVARAFHWLLAPVRKRIVPNAP